MNLLFICNQNKNRSKTAEELFKPFYETRSRGLYGGKKLTQKDTRWAEIIFVMEEDQAEQLRTKFPQAYTTKRIICLDIPDIYSYQQPKLIQSIKENMKKYKHLL